MPEITLPQGTIAYRAVGPEHSALPPVVFVHGFWVDSRLWDGVADRLAQRGVRCYLPDWPLGSHRTPLSAAADRTPRGIARIVIAAIEALQLEDVTLVGNDTGGAICQFVLDTDASRIGRLVLTNCDAFDNFPPFPFNLYFKLGRSATLIRMLLAPMRIRAVRQSPAGFGMLARRPDPALTRDWLTPGMTDPAIRADTVAFLRGVDPAELLDVSTRLHRFDKPVRIVWGQADRFFKPAYGRRLRDLFADATLTEVADARTFVALDDPGVVAEQILQAGNRSAGMEPAGMLPGSHTSAAS